MWMLALMQRQTEIIITDEFVFVEKKFLSPQFISELKFITPEILFGFGLNSFTKNPSFICGYFN